MTAPSPAVGDEVEYPGVPGHPMTVRAVRPCDDGGHNAVLVLDPEGVEDWVCERAMRLVRRAGGAT